MEQEEHKRIRFPIWFRVVAAIVAVAILTSLAANGIVAVRIKAASESEAAINYLVDNTGYVNADTIGRLQDKLQILTEPQTLEDYYRLAGTQIAEEDYEGALGSIDACIALDDGSNQELHLDLLMKRGCLLVMLERDEEALAPLDQVLLEVPEQTDALLVKAQIYAKQEDMSNLVRTLEQYLGYEAGNTEIRLLLAQAMFSIEDYTGARNQYRKVLEGNEPLENETQIHYLYGLTCIQLGEFADAETYLTLALEKDSSLMGLHYYIGVCQMSREAYPEAVESFNAAIDQGSMLQLSHYSRGISGLMIDNYDTALLLGDLTYAAEYSGSDVDESISVQAAQLLQQLTEVG